MARTGITQAQVDAAADALLLAGERPTIERVRARLGTGAPATLIRLLDVWWKALGDRLQTQAVKLTLPDAPPSVAAAASQLWLLALEQAKDAALRDLQPAQAALESDRVALQGQQAQLLTRAAEAEAHSIAALAGQAQAESRLQDLQRLLDQLADQLKDLQGQRDAAMNELPSLRDNLAAAQAAHAGAIDRAAEERTSLEAAHRLAEDRWMREVDRARQESERLAANVRKLEHANEAAGKAAADRMAGASKTIRQAEREDAVKSERIAALQMEMERLHSQLRAALSAQRKDPRRISTAKRPPKTATTD